MKLPEPAGTIQSIDAFSLVGVAMPVMPPVGTHLFTEAQLREALASHEAVMRTVLELLGPQAPECCGCAAEWNEAIKALKEQLK